jgi:hypothetical protein
MLVPSANTLTASHQGVERTAQARVEVEPVMGPVPQFQDVKLDAVAPVGAGFYGWQGVLAVTRNATLLSLRNPRTDLSLKFLKPSRDFSDCARLDAGLIVGPGGGLGSGGLLALYGSLTPLLRPDDQLVIKVCAGPGAIGFAMLPPSHDARPRTRGGRNSETSFP